MKFILPIVLILAGCVSVPTINGIYSWDYQSSASDIRMKEYRKVVMEDEDTEKRSYDYWFYFIYENPGYTHIVQEIHLSNGKTVVESFRIKNINEAILDCHSWKGSTDIRKMFVYFADVVDADERGRFAMLPQNKSGLKTTVGKEFNREYQEKYEIKGRIVREDRKSGFTWYLSYVDKTLEVVIPEHRKAD